MPSAAFKKALASATKKLTNVVSDPWKAAKFIKLSSPRLNYIYGGANGYRTGVIHRYTGPESGGKSTLCTYIASQFQQHYPDRLVAYMDFERSFDAGHAQETGLIIDEDHFVYMTADCLEDASSVLEELVKTGEISCVIFDSESMATTRTILTDELGKACVAPMTFVTYKKDSHSETTVAPIQCMFQEAGIEDFSKMPVNTLVEPSVPIYIESFKDKAAVWKKVEYLMYKGESNDWYKVKSNNDSNCFYGTGEHKVYLYDDERYVTLKEAFELQNRKTVRLVDKYSIPVGVTITKDSEVRPVLDIQVEDTQCYFTGGFLSHNTFGGQAKLLKDFLIRFTPLCANYDCTMLVISQERQQMGMSHAIQTCVVPDTLINIYESSSSKKQDIKLSDFFKKVGYEDFKNLKVGKFYDISDKQICIDSYNVDTEKFEKKLIKSVVYKGEGQVWRLVDPYRQEIILEGTGDHRVYDCDKKEYVALKDIGSKATLLTDIGNKIEATVEKTDTVSPILDIEVEDNENYFHNGVLGHNTGGYSIKYIGSTLMRVKRIETLTLNGKDVGIHMNVRNLKNKTGMPWRTTDLDLMFVGGFDPTIEYVDFLKDFADDPRLAPVMKAGGSGTYKSEKYGVSVRGRDNMMDWARNPENKEIWEEIKAIIDDILANPNKLDASRFEVAEDEKEVMAEARRQAEIESGKNDEAASEENEES